MKWGKMGEIWNFFFKLELCFERMVSRFDADSQPYVCWSEGQLRCYAKSGVPWRCRTGNLGSWQGQRWPQGWRWSGSNRGWLWAEFGEPQPCVAWAVVSRWCSEQGLTGWDGWTGSCEKCHEVPAWCSWVWCDWTVHWNSIQSAGCPIQFEWMSRQWWWDHWAGRCSPRDLNFSDADFGKVLLGLGWGGGTVFHHSDVNGWVNEVLVACEVGIFYLPTLTQQINKFR